MRLEIEELGDYELDLDCGAIRTLTPFPGAEAVEQALCGPALALLLAAGGDYLLHAAAVRVAAGVLALAGRSGTGKSTFGAELAATTGALAVADDALPLRLRGRSIFVPGGYPQLKWPRWGARRLTGPPPRLLSVIELTPGGGDVRLERLPANEALLAAAGHTVAARLFDPSLLARHFRFCAEIAAHTSWWRLHFQPRLRNLPRMVDEIRRLWSG